MTTNDENNKTYWRKNVRVLCILLFFWFMVSFGAAILFGEALDQYTLGGFKLGFWFGQQGAIYGFLIIIAIYIRYMNRLDRKYEVDED